MYKWIQANDNLWKLVDSMIKQYLPDYWERLMSLPIPLEKRYFKCFPLAAVNLNCNVPEHVDSLDDENGFNVTIPFGDFEIGGGRLHFPDLNMTMDDYIGDMVGFRGVKLRHLVKEYIGTRFAVILTSHDDCYFPPDPDRKGKNTVIKNGYKQHLN